MCYSAMVEQDMKVLRTRYKAEISKELYADIFSRRLNGEKINIGRAMERPFLNSEAPEDEEIAKTIRIWHDIEITRLQSELFKQKKRLADAERSITTGKITKKALNDQRVAKAKIEKFLPDIIKHQKLGIPLESDGRIFPFHYFSMLTLNKNGQKIIMPVRYHMRPHDKDENFDREFDGCYNARFDNLTRVAWWKEALGKRHGIILVKKFYENVDPAIYAKKNKLPAEDKKKKNIILCFEPDDTEYMFIPTLWDIWKKKGHPDLYSGALITDEPAPEIAATGHDRTPIFLKESAIDRWLAAKGTLAEIKESLSEREFPHYSHKLVGVA